MWKVTWLCALFLSLSGYCFANVETKPTTCEPEKREPLGNYAKPEKHAAQCKAMNPSWKKVIAAIRPHTVFLQCFGNNEESPPAFVDAGIGGWAQLQSPVFEIQLCPDGFSQVGDVCIKPKSCKCPNDKDWVISMDQSYCWKDEPGYRAEYCREKANGYDVKTDTIQGGCYKMPGLPSAYGCFYGYDEKVCLMDDESGISVAICGPGVKNTGVLCTIDPEDPKEEEKPREPQSQSDCKDGQTFHPNAIDGKNVCMNEDGTHDNGKGEEGSSGEGGNNNGNNGNASGGNGEASGGNGEGNGNGNGGGDGEGSCPSWAKSICDFFSPTDNTKIEEPKTGGLPGSNTSAEAVNIDTSDKFMGAGYCPAPIIVPINLGVSNSAIEIPYTFICQFAQILRPLFVLFSMVMAGRLLFGGK